jgi:hypothetical protein
MIMWLGHCRYLAQAIQISSVGHLLDKRVFLCYNLYV